MEEKEVANNIRKFRELKEKTREFMAAELDLSLSGYSKIERGETDITLTKLYKIAEILEVGVYEILNFDVKKIFNSNHNTNSIQCAKTVDVHVSQPSDHTEKYIKLLEDENLRLKEKLESKE